MANHIETLVALGDVYTERVRQEQLRESGKFPWTCANKTPSHGDKLAVLLEEVGEVARAIVETFGVADARNVSLRHELIHVAAVAVAWAESIQAPTQSTTVSCSPYVPSWEG